jgi:hypothetical protein
MAAKIATSALLLTGIVLSAATPVTYHKDVSRILQNRCQGCHRPGEIGPMPLLTYEQTRPWAKAIRETVKLKKMPPWFAEAAHGTFENDRSLSSAEIATISSWVEQGAPEGNPKDAPKPLAFVDGWRIGTPDAIIQMPTAFELPASGALDYQFVALPSGFTEDKWVEQLEVRPGNRAVVHHVVVYAREPGSPMYKNLKPGIPSPVPNSGIRNRTPDDGTGIWSIQTGAEIVCTYVPGGEPCKARPGQARLIKAGSDLLFQLHYTPNGKPASDLTRIGLVFAKERPKERVRTMLVLNPNLRIPPGVANHRVDARVTLNAPATLTSLFPHMHYRGKSFEYRAVYPTGESELLLKVPRYDFNWQMTYYFDKPRVLPKGATIECIAHYDNSPNNPANPDSKAEVLWGDQSWEEMLAGFVDLAFDVNMDPSELAKGKQLRTQ